MDQDKVIAVKNWPIPTTTKEQQRFLGFYRRFIRGFSSIAAPLMSLLKKGPKKLHWNTLFNQVFEYLKKTFTSAPILKHLDPSRPFIVKVDTSETGVEDVLSQRFGEKLKFYPLPFFH